MIIHMKVGKGEGRGSRHQIIYTCMKLKKAFNKGKSLGNLNHFHTFSRFLENFHAFFWKMSILWSVQNFSIKFPQYKIIWGSKTQIFLYFLYLPTLPLRLLHTMNVRFSLLDIAQRILGVTLPNFQ